MLTGKHQPFEAVIFDADGTLVDTEGITLDVLYEQAQRHGFDMPQAAAYPLFRGKRMALCIHEIGQHMGKTLPDHFIDDVRQATALRFEQGVRCMPGAVSLVRKLHADRRMPYCVATNGPRMKVTQTLTLSGLSPYFADLIFCAYEVGSFKPDPGLFLHAASAMGQLPQSCCVVEDSVPGVQAGLDAGMQVFYVGLPDVLSPAMRQQVSCLTHLGQLQDLIEGQYAPC